MAIITGWHSYKLVEFLQRRNPNVFSVIDKVSAPQTRNLTEAKKFWKQVAAAAESIQCPLRGLGGTVDIYTTLPLEISDMSLDHFIPWSFVLHDRLWNLAPVSKSINSSKSDMLPPLDKYLESFIDLQYRAFSIAVSHGFSKSMIEDYIILGGAFLPAQASIK